MTKLDILVVDDDLDSAESLGILLGGWGHNVTLSNSGEDALAQFARRRFDITFMDVRLPGINGTEAFLRIREIDPAARVVMMTGYSVKPLLARALERGALEVFSKPLDFPRVRAVLDATKTEAVLIVDDDEDFRLSVRHLLAGRGYRVYITGDADTAVELISGGKVNVLVLDMKLPGLSGQDIVDRLRRNGSIPPTIVVTAFGREFAEVLGALETGSGATVLRKPFDPASLVSAVEELAAAR